MLFQNGRLGNQCQVAGTQLKREQAPFSCGYPIALGSPANELYPLAIVPFKGDPRRIATMCTVYTSIYEKDWSPTESFYEKWGEVADPIMREAG